MQVTDKAWSSLMIQKYSQNQGSSVNLAVGTGIRLMNIDDRTSYKCYNCQYIDIYLCKQPGFEYLSTDLVLLYASAILPVSNT